MTGHRIAIQAKTPLRSIGRMIDKLETDTEKARALRLMRLFEAREKVVKAALFVASDHIAQDVNDPHADASSELHDDILDEAITEYNTVKAEQ